LLELGIIWGFDIAYNPGVFLQYLPGYWWDGIL